MKTRLRQIRSNLKVARALWGDLPHAAADGLKYCSQKHTLSVAAGDLNFLDGRWYVTHAGLLRLAQRH